MKKIKNGLLFVVKPRTESIIGLFFLCAIYLVVIIFEIILIINEALIARAVGIMIAIIIPVTIVVCISQLEFYEIYKDRVIARNPIKMLNIVYLDNITKIEEIKIIAEHQTRYFYILNDGRKYCNSLRMPKNTQDFNLYLLKTEQTTAFIKEQLKLPVMDRDRKEDYPEIVKKYF